MTTLCKYLSTCSALRNIILKHLSWYSNIHTVKMIQIIILNMRMNFFPKYTSPTKCKVIGNSFLDISESPQFILFKVCCTFRISWCSQLILSIFPLKEILVFFLLGYTSYRDTERGSWFIQEFVDVFYEHADEEHVMDMLTEVRTYQSSQYLDYKIGNCFQKRFVFAIYRYRCKKKKLEHISYSCNTLSWYYIILHSKMFT